MNSFFCNLFFWSTSFITLLVLGLCMETGSEVRRFVVLSEFETTYKFYPRIRRTKPNFQKEPDIDIATKKQICRDIFSNYQFARWNEYPYEESSSYSYIYGLLRGQILKNYATGTIDVYTYVKPEYVSEYVFVCLTRQRSKIRKYFVSEEYNLNTESDSLDNYIAGRFVFDNLDKRTTVNKLAELPARVLSFSTSGHDIEQLYLQKRDENLPGGFINRFQDKDPLCKLHIREKLRICLAVFNSMYFVGKIDSLTRLRVSNCEKKIVSFRTEDGKAKTAGRTLNEWTMSCNTKNDKRRFDYLLSQAYESNKIFVYSWKKDTQQMFLENLSTNVRFPVANLRRRYP